MTGPAAPLLSVSGLSKRFAGVTALDAVSLGVSAGSVVGLIGPNGSGKSTLIDCVSGFQVPDAGRVVLEGRDVTRWEPHELARAGLTRTFQTTRVYERMTLLAHFSIGAQEFDSIGWAEAYMGSRRLKEREHGVRSRALALLNDVGLLDYADAPAGMLSYGQRKLLTLAASLIAKPRIVLLDEPLAGVNPTMVNQIGDALRRLNASGQTFLIVEHNVDFVVSVCHRVVVLDAGRRLTDGPPTIIRDDPRVLEAYLGISSMGDEVA